MNDLPVFFLSKQPIASKALHVVFSYLLHMHKWLVNQAASEFQLWCRGVATNTIFAPFLQIQTLIIQNFPNKMTQMDP
jgi:hypothetical protein